MSADGDVAGLVPAARLLSRLLLREVDDSWRAEVGAPEVAAAFQEIGIELPEVWDFDALAAEFFETFLNPAHGAPPVESLWTEGRYEADCAVALRKIAGAAGFEFEGHESAGVPVDHLGCILLLWAECIEGHPDLAGLLADEHLGWVPRALATASQRDGFYGSVAAATVAFCGVLGAAAGNSDAGE